MPLTQIEPYYSVGTASFTTGSDIITGQGTAWLANIDPGDEAFNRIGQKAPPIKAVLSDTQIQLTRPFLGTAQVAGEYDIRNISDSYRLENLSQRSVNLLKGGGLQSVADRLAAADGDQMLYANGPNSTALTPLTAFGRSLSAAANSSTALTSLGVSAFWQGRMADENAGAARTGLGAQESLEYLDNIELGRMRTGDRVAFIDFHASNGLDFSARLLRRLGVNGNLQIDQTGTGVIDVTGGSDFQRAGRTIYHKGNVLGVVGQSAGIPTGAVIERGANANGQYVRYADGTQICWGNRTSTDVSAADGPIYRTSTATWNFPAAFVGTPSCFVSGVTGASLSWGSLGAGGATGTSTTWVIYRATLSLSLPLAGLLAIGRWF